MIKTNELKHNGYFNHNGLIVQISGFRTYSTDKPLVRFENTGGEYGIDTLQPIPLTEEWLLKAGFKAIGIDGNRWILKYKINNPFTIESYNYIFYSPICTWIEFKYVHELQNLYFALTGEELVFSTEP